LEVLKSKARSRIALRAAAAAAVSAGILLGGVPLFHASADTKTVAYSCTGTSSQTPELTATLTAPANATLNQTFTLTWSHAAAAAPATAFTAPAAIATTDRLVFVGDIILTGPGAAAATTLKATVTSSPVASITQGGVIPIPAVTASVTPNATGTITAKTGQFVLSIGPAGGTATTTYTCTIATGGSAAAATIVVASASVSASASASSTPSASVTTHTPLGTRTVYETVTASTRTPAGGAATGGGGDLGPDARVLVIGGLGLAIAAALGGLLMRARRGGPGAARE
jgi:hypothetical protein